jgi:hypothetical protein
VVDSLLTQGRSGFHTIIIMTSNVGAELIKRQTALDRCAVQWRNTWRIPLAEEFLRGNIEQGDTLEVHAAGEQLALQVTVAGAT